MGVTEYYRKTVEVVCDLTGVEEDSYAEMMSAVTGLARANATGTALSKE